MAIPTPMIINLGSADLNNTHAHGKNVKLYLFSHGLIAYFRMMMSVALLAEVSLAKTK